MKNAPEPIAAMECKRCGETKALIMKWGMCIECCTIVFEEQKKKEAEQKAKEGKK